MCCLWIYPALLLVDLPAACDGMEAKAWGGGQSFEHGGYTGNSNRQVVHAVFEPDTSCQCCYAALETSSAAVSLAAAAQL